MYRFRRITFSFLPVVILWASTQVALAHALLLGGDPLPDALLQSAPSHVRLLFSEDLNGPASSIVVWDEKHRRVSRGTASLVRDYPRAMQVQLEPLPPGSYVVSWTAVSVDDGHIVRGSYIFSVKIRSPAALLAGGSNSTAGQGLPDAATLLSLLAHWIGLLATVTWVGAAAFSALVFTPVASRIQRSTVESESRSLVSRVRASILILLAASSAGLLAQMYTLASGDWTVALSASTISTVFEGQYGHLWIARQLVALLALLTTLPLPTKRSVPSLLSSAVAEGASWHLRVWVPAALGFLYLYALAGSGHAASAAVGAIRGSHFLSAGVFVDWLHLLGVALWLGGQIYIVLVLVPALRPGQDTAGNGRQFLAVLDRFSPLAYLSVATLAVTGSFNGKVHIPSWSAFFSSTYGRALTVKLALIGLMMLISAFTVYRLRPRIRRTLDGTESGPAPAGEALMKTLVGWLRVNPILGTGVLLATSVMFFYPVPATFSAASTAAGAQWQPVGLPGVTVHAVIFGHRNPDLVFAAVHGGIVRRSRDGAWRSIFQSGDIWDINLAFDDRRLVAADNDGHVDLTNDAGAHWRRVLLTPEGVYAVSIRPGAPRWMLAGASGGLYLSRDGGLHWKRRLALPQSAGAAFAWEPGSSRVVFAGAVAGGPKGRTDVFISRDAGLTWQVFGRHLASTGGIMSLAVTPRHRVFAGTMGNAMWLATLTAQTWRKAAQGMPTTEDHVAGIATVPGRPDLLFAGTLGQGVFETRDGGAHWTNISQGLSSSLGASIVLSVAYAPAQHALFAGTADGVYELTPVG